MPIIIDDLEQYHADLDSELEAVLRPREGLLYDMMLYQLGWADRQGEPLPKPRPPRPYALLTLLSCQAAGVSHRPALPAAAAMELVHTFIEVHKDVQEGNPRQEARPSVWWVLGTGPGHQRRRRPPRPGPQRPLPAGRCRSAPGPGSSGPRRSRRGLHPNVRGPVCRTFPPGAVGHFPLLLSEDGHGPHGQHHVLRHDPGGFGRHRQQ